MLSFITRFTRFIQNKGLFAQLNVYIVIVFLMFNYIVINHLVNHLFVSGLNHYQGANWQQIISCDENMEIKQSEKNSLISL